MSKHSSIESKVLESLRLINPLQDGLSIPTNELVSVENLTRRHWADIREVLKSDSNLTKLEKSLLIGGDGDREVALHGMVPAQRLLEEGLVSASMTEIARRVVEKLQKRDGKNLEDLPADTVSKMRAIIVFKLREALEGFKDKNCLIGAEQSFNSLKGLATEKLKQYNQEKTQILDSSSHPEIGLALLESKFSIQMMKDLEIVNEAICPDDKETLEKLNRSRRDAFELYDALGNELYKHDKDVEKMYKHYFPKGTLHKKKTGRNPLTSMDNNLKSLSFIALCEEFFNSSKEDLKGKSEKERLRIYHIQIILWLTIGFFQLNQRPGRAKEGIRQSLDKSIEDYIKNLAPSGKDATKETDFTVNGKREPLTLRSMSLGDEELDVYAGEKYIDVKKSTPSMLRLMRNGTKDLVIPDMLRGETVFYNKNAKEFNKEDENGKKNIEMAENYLKGLGEALGLEINNKLDYMNLKPGEGCIEAKIGKKSSPESFKFTAIKLYGNLVFAEHKETGVIMQVHHTDTAQKFSLEEWTLHEERFEYRVVAGDTWKTANYNKLHPSHHDHFRLKQIMEIAEHVVRPPENLDLYANIRANKAMINACEKRESKNVRRQN